METTTLVETLNENTLATPAQIWKQLNYDQFKEQLEKMVKAATFTHPLLSQVYNRVWILLKNKISRKPVESG